MIIVTGTLTVDPDKRDEVIDAARTAMAATRAEDGCLSYALAADPLMDDTIVIVEEWASDQALATHGRSTHMAAFGEKLGKIGGLRGSTLVKHVVASSGPLTG